MKKRSSFILFVFLFGSLLTAREKTVVFPFVNHSDNRTAQWLSYGLEILLEDSLDSIPMAQRMDSVDSMDVPDSDDLTLATRIIIARKLGATHLIIGSFSVSKEKIDIELSQYEMNQLISKKWNCSVALKGFPFTLSTFINREIGGNYPYPKDFSGHRFEAYVRGMLRAIANSDFQNILKLAKESPNCTPLNRNLANVLYDTGHYRESLSCLKRLPKTDRHVLFRSGMCCVQLEKYADGLTFFLRALKYHRDTASIVNAGGCLLFLGHPAESMAFLNSLPDSIRNSVPMIIFNQAVVSAQQKNWPLALNRLSQYISVFRFTDEAKQLTSYCCANCNCKHPLCLDENGKESEIKKPMDPKTLYQFPENQPGKETALDLKEIKELYLKKATQALKSGSRAEAIEALRKILCLNPLQKDALTLLCNECGDKSACQKLHTLNVPPETEETSGSK